jgi:hypothetical protein
VAKTVPTDAPPQAGRARGEPSGWIVFAATMLFMVGMFDAIWGLGAILNDQVVTVGGKGAIVWDITVWGWIHLLVGLVMIADLGRPLHDEGLRALAGHLLRDAQRDPPGPAC